MRRIGLALLVAVSLVAVIGPPAHAARKKFPKHLDPKSWVVPEDMEWGDYKRIPGVDWLGESNAPPKTLRAALDPR